MRKEAVLIFGLDGATWKLLGPWIRQGKLPFLAAMAEKGAKGTLKSTLPSLTSTAWVSFQTGVSPSLHGILGFQKTNGKLFSANDVEYPTFWNIAGKNGKRCAIINMPLTFPPRPLNGCLVTSFLTPPKSGFTYPPRLQKQLQKFDYQIDIMFKKQGFAEEKKLNERQKEQLLQDINRLIESREKAAGWIIDKDGGKQWDIFFVLFKATDIVQHFFWQERETLAVYRKIDRVMERLVKKYQTKHPQTKVNVLIISDHGFHPSAKKDICFYPLLGRMGWLPAVSRRQLKVLRGIRKVSGKRLVKKFFPRQKMKITDWGVYWPEADQEKVNRLAKELSKQKLNGRKVFSQVLVNKNRQEGLPVILWLTDPRFAPNADPLSEKLFYPKKTSLKAHHYSDRNGIFVAAGPNVKRSKKPPLLRIFDLAPNILKMMGVVPPKKMEGRLFPKLFSFPRPVRQGKSKTLPKSKPTNKAKDDDETVIINRLRALGYVD